MNLSRFADVPELTEVQLVLRVQNQKVQEALAAEDLQIELEQAYKKLLHRYDIVIKDNEFIVQNNI